MNSESSRTTAIYHYGYSTRTGTRDQLGTGAAQLPRHDEAELRAETTRIYQNHSTPSLVAAGQEKHSVISANMPLSSYEYDDRCLYISLCDKYECP